jgi:peroxiredoxin
LRDEYQEFQRRDAEILSIGPENQEAFRRYWETEHIPFPGLADPTHRVAKLYRQQIKLTGFGRMPATLLVDKQGRIRFQHFGDSMKDIPPNKQILALLDALNAEASAEEKGDAPGQ